jgi:hypothetical protein
MDWTGLDWTGVGLGSCSLCTEYLPHNRVRQGSKIVVGVLIMNRNKILVISYAMSDGFSE